MNCSTVMVSEAVIIMQKPDIQIDVVLCDIEMPGAMNRLRLREVGAHTVVLGWR